jgi:protein AroM
MGPASDMVAAPTQWQPYVTQVSTAAVSPYDTNDRLAQAACMAQAAGADYILLDDMGFTEKQRRLVRTVSGIRTLNATSITARVLQELI